MNACGLHSLTLGALCHHPKSSLCSASATAELEGNEHLSHSSERERAQSATLTKHRLSQIQQYIDRYRQGSGLFTCFIASPWWIYSMYTLRKTHFVCLREIYWSIYKIVGSEHRILFPTSTENVLLERNEIWWNSMQHANMSMRDLYTEQC